jgi:hypothetical protein
MKSEKCKMGSGAASDALPIGKLWALSLSKRHFALPTFHFALQ